MEKELKIINIKDLIEKYFQNYLKNKRKEKMVQYVQ
jgi:hemerythrin superfamily protein